MKEKKPYRVLLLSIFILLLVINLSGLVLAAANKPVIITNEGEYYNVCLDYNSGLTHQQMGAEYAAQIKTILPEYEALVDSYIAEITMSDEIYQLMLFRTGEIKPQVNQDYLDEIEGMASQFSGGADNVRGDQKISRDEFYFFNLIPDAIRETQCSAVAVFGSGSALKQTMVARNLDWYGGSANQIPQIQAVITVRQKDKSICSIGYLGFQGVITGFNRHGVFAGILDSGSGAPYVSKDRNSYPLDLRYALENNKTLNDVAGFMKDPARNYTCNHLIFLAGPKDGQVLENNFSGCDTARRALRSSQSKLNPGINWGFNQAVGAVNSFLLSGNFDNHTQYPHNVRRWASLCNELKKNGPVITWDELKAIISFDNGDGPGGMEEGDLYNGGTQQTILFIPATMRLEIFFRPHDGGLPADPVFKEIKVKLD
ncbi:MAG: hypothetical protein K6U80_02510 [Firmicutes bacterium]|nr:hypothetical protein [Bacillota bacterium]